MKEKEPISKYNFKNQVVLITGGAQGIGASTALKFAKSGAKLVIADIDLKKLNKFKEKIDSSFEKSEVLLIQTDVSKEKDVKRMVKESINYFKKIDILFNNAGLTTHCLLKDMKLVSWRKIMKVNLDGMFLVAREVGNKMIKQKKGKIINTASISGYIINRNRQNAAYSISKAGVIMLTKALAVELAKYDIDVNAIAPGYTLTPMVSEAFKKDPNKKMLMEKEVPLNRLAESEEIAKAVLYLASSDTTYINGHTLIIDGGYTIW
jgi:NAD(P)-dependent dehydrogenase (short-subunit alcohol dehydrogenase family)